ncbi:hypothetical protein [Actinoplanes utahensis]|uniref:Uncharacterized protein n=1 Tax=Actinoplanes utahensis TaxID=1869 RepID=A0A0A6UKS7_ACTUT|nr:hypothetical protein [Actinoplanes utahensis]KHD75688.1 hypothetical protein MB27_20860 [Actinoplanes utahensis]
MTGRERAALRRWQRIRHYAVPEWMVAECTAARERGDWRRACEAAGVVAGSVSPASWCADTLGGFAPDLLRWHAPRAGGGHTTIATDLDLVLTPDAPFGPDTPVLAVRTPPEVYAPQRMRLRPIRAGSLDPLRTVWLAPYQWDARRAGEVRAAVGGDGRRIPFFAADGGLLPVAALGCDDDGPARAERAWLTRAAGPQSRGEAPTGDGRPAPRWRRAIGPQWQEAGLLPAEALTGDEWPAPRWRQVAAVVDPWRLTAEARRLAALTGRPHWMMRYPRDGSAIRVEVGGDTVRAVIVQQEPAAGLPWLHPAQVGFSADLQLLRHDMIDSAELHPLVRAALFPARWPARAGEREPGHRLRAVARPGPAETRDGARPAPTDTPVVPARHQDDQCEVWAGARPAPAGTPVVPVRCQDDPREMRDDARPARTEVPVVPVRCQDDQGEVRAGARVAPAGHQDDRHEVRAGARPAPAGTPVVPVRCQDDRHGMRDGARVVPAGTRVVLVRCQDGRHEVRERAGWLSLAAHSDGEIAREQAMRAFGGAPSGCFAATQGWSGPQGRLPRRLRQARADLWQRMLHGGTRAVLELLDAGMDPMIRDGAGRALIHRVGAFGPGLLPALLAAGAPVDAPDRQGRTALAYAVVEDWPFELITALIEAGADPHAGAGDVLDPALVPPLIASARDGRGLIDPDSYRRATRRTRAVSHM